MGAAQVTLKLVVEKKANRVAFAECGSDFVDVLLSFLTMPIGTIVRISRKDSKILGSMSALYESVESLDVNLLRTEACKKMLLHPRSASEEHFKNLKVNIDDTEPTKYYICSWDCCAKNYHFISAFSNVRCRCGQSMNKQIVFNKKSNDVGNSKDGVFVRGNMRFIIRDDLQLFPASMGATFTLLNELGIGSASVLEERSVNIGAAEVLRLLRRLLLSKTPLTDMFLRDQAMINQADLDLHLKDMALDSKELTQPKEEKGIGSESKKMSVKLLVSKSNKKVVYAEGGEEFTDLLFSFLAFPLGSVTKFFGGDSGIGCLDNLYRSVEVLSIKDLIKSEECKGLLVDPNLAAYFSSINQPLQLKEQVPWKPFIISCDLCNYLGGPITITDQSYTICKHSNYRTQLYTINPKDPNAVKELGGAYIAGPALFLVTDELNVNQLSPMLGISLLTKFNISTTDLEEHVVSVGEEEAASLLKASLISKTVLTDVFFPKKPKHLVKKSYWLKLRSDD